MRGLLLQKRATISGPTVVIVEFVGVVVRGILAREPNMTAKTIAVTAIPTIVGSNGTIAQAPDICLSLSSRVRKSRLRFSSGMLKVVTLLKSGSGRFFYLRQWNRSQLNLHSSGTRVRPRLGLLSL